MFATIKPFVANALICFKQVLFNLDIVNIKIRFFPQYYFDGYCTKHFFSFFPFTTGTLIFYNDRWIVKCICKERVRGVHRRGTARPHVVLPGLRVPKALYKGGADLQRRKYTKLQKLLPNR